MGLKSSLLAVAAEESDYVDSPISRDVDIGFGVGFMALHIGSAVYGFSSTSECREMKAAVEELEGCPGCSATQPD